MPDRGRRVEARGSSVTDRCGSMSAGREVPVNRRGRGSSSSPSASATSFSSIVEEDVAGTFDKPRLGRIGGGLSACVELAGCCG
jgi:hypothetical protein